MHPHPRRDSFLDAYTSPRKLIKDHKKRYQRDLPQKECVFTDCNQHALPPTSLCRAHGGGLRCIVDNCENGGEKNGFCANHQPQCRYVSCKNVSRAGHDVCSVHLRGVRMCSVEGCGEVDSTKTGFCVSHQKYLWTTQLPQIKREQYVAPPPVKKRPACSITNTYHADTTLKDMVTELKLKQHEREARAASPTDVENDQIPEWVSRSLRKGKSGKRGGLHAPSPSAASEGVFLEPKSKVKYHHGGKQKRSERVTKETSSGQYAPDKGERAIVGQVASELQGGRGYGVASESIATSASDVDSTPVDVFIRRSLGGGSRFLDAESWVVPEAKQSRQRKQRRGAPVGNSKQSKKPVQRATEKGRVKRGQIGGRSSVNKPVSKLASPKQARRGLDGQHSQSVARSTTVNKPPALLPLISSTPSPRGSHRISPQSPSASSPSAYSSKMAADIQQRFDVSALDAQRLRDSALLFAAFRGPAGAREFLQSRDKRRTTGPPPQRRKGSGITLPAVGNVKL